MGSLTYHDLSADEYKQALEDDGRCANCLSDEHVLEDCDSCGECRGEGGRWHLVSQRWIACTVCNGSGDRDVTEVIPRG